jgi:pyruvate formate lyase activating enzyme
MYMSAEKDGIIFDIERFSVHDGPGIRTVVFLKGCPLKCQWCANPESQKTEPQVGFFPDRCLSCLKCSMVCPFGDFFREKNDINWAQCINCFQCVDACIYNARIKYGRKITASEVLDIVKRDVVFYRNSRGGITLSGGEATYQPLFSISILKKCQKEGLHTALETCGFVSWSEFDKILDYVDLLLYDIKHMNSKKHKEGTGVANEIILENAKKASKKVSEMIIRFPLIPQFNEDDDNIKKMAYFISNELDNVIQVDILPYHSMGKSKSEIIGKEYKFNHEIQNETVLNVRKIFESFGLNVSIGG